MAMRLMGRGIELQDKDGSFQRLILNRPRHVEEYKEFRKITLHLTTLTVGRDLFVAVTDVSSSVVPITISK
ncbi:MAG: hypothetical protein K8F52_13105 [Candidatus Scalindua rubra]|uniref:Uncharacterized protein n=1 Tax=Candidatus Scalindua brodae TaxID=237368 RepID=A0A0B0EAZ4_9BACT|nr:MAG: hypothetical protein SCABRO_03832 [Candidatus Scalindua brodae]MBZ0109599.1 hypothetical protein [Candidatus Scalindua rubra]TWU33147.1 hypothetical protein S225a_15990 [Candidatus Brocadiaceae bacterium S225]